MSLFVVLKLGGIGMQASSRLVRSVAAALAAGMLAPEAAHAQYLDPGAASVIVQVVIAGFVGVAGFVSFSWGRISSFFTRSSKGDRPR